MRVIATSLPLLLFTLMGCSFSGWTHAMPQPTSDADWPNVGNDKGAMRYSTLTQIDRSNVAKLQVAWTYRTGDAGKGTALECVPIVIKGVMYLTTVGLKAVALDAATGREIWKFDPYAEPRIKSRPYASHVNRGLAYWTDGNEARILYGIPAGWLVALDAKTGKPDPKFGEGGLLDLRKNMGRYLNSLEYGVTSAPAIYKDTVILGFLCGEGPGFEAPGDVRAFDVRTGKEAWRFHTVPGPGEIGNETWKSGSAKNHGAANAWSGATVDEERGLVFVGTGSAAPDFYGGDRPGDNLFANCTIALDANTGKRVWHFQTVHHDITDHDLPTYPNLVTVNHAGKQVDAVAQVTKTGFVYLFDRVTGKPLFPIEERKVPKSDVPGEKSSPTQPFPLKPPPFARQTITEKDLTDLSPEAHFAALKQFRKLRTDGPLTPPSLRGSLAVPGLLGGANWSGASFDPTTGILYVNSNNLPYILQLKKSLDGSNYPFDFMGYTHFLDKDGYPAIKPPWGLLTAIDLNKGTIAWQVPLGEFPELKAKGIPQTGTKNFGGTIVTASGILFIGGSADEMFHAFDKATGKLLWETKLPAGGYATPCTYSVNGRQFVVIAAGGGGKAGTKSGDSYVAFAVPQ